MKTLQQFLIILLFTLLGELLNYYIPLPIPASIYGIVLLFLALLFKIVKLQQVESVSLFLIEIMPVMFIPAAVGLINSVDELAAILPQTIIILIISTMTVMVSTGKTAMLMVDKEQRHE